ncbi:hypothetical protein HK098_000427 [Nowakowskiella sp. JEL0407]|nr:hypothetical protein HK098_000427 [Nowakowskiella sp. JEL0407]
MYSMRPGTPDGFQIERPRSRVSSTSPEPRSPVPKHTQILICGNDIGAFASAFTLARDGFKVILVKYGLNRNSTLSTSEIGLLNEYFNLFGSGNALSPRISRISTLGDASMSSFEKKRSLQFDGLYNIKTSDTYRFNRRQDSSNQSINQTEGALLAKAKAIGIYVLEEFNVLTVNSKSKIIFCEHTRTGEKRSIHFEYIIDSCGVSVLGGSDLKSPSSDKVRGFSLSGEWKCAKPLKSGGIDGPVFVDKLEVNGTVVGWTWVTSVSKDTLSVGIVILKKELFQMKKFSTETIDETYFRLINKAAPATKSYLSDLGARFMQNIPVTLDENLNFYVNFTTGSNVRVIGEAGLSLPLLGCGSKFSLASGISAAATIAAEIRGVDTKISELFHERFLLKLHTLLLVQNAAAFELADGSGFKMLKSWNFEALKDCFGSIEPILTLVINRLTQAGVISAYLSYSDVWIRALLFFTQPKIDSRCQTLLNDILGGEEEASLEYYVLLTILGLKETFFNLSDCLQKVTIDGISMNVENGELGLILEDAGQLEQWPANGYTELSFNSDDEISDLTTTKNSPTKKYQSNEVGSSARAAKSKQDHPSTLPYSHQLYLFRSLISQWRISEIYGFIIDTNHPVFIGSFMGLLEGSAQIVIKDQEEFEEVLKRSLSVLDHELHAEGKTVYGVTTGFGGNADTKSNDTVGVQMGLIQHLNSGMSNQLLHSNVVRGAMALRIVSMSRGYSAVRWEVVESLKKLVDSGISPCVPLRGSISASGDLMPLSYVAGLLSGRFEDDEKAAKMITVNDEVYLSGKEALQKAGIDGPLVFQAKEALALVNGTSMSCALAVKCLLDVHSLSLLTQAITAFSVEILAGHIDAFDPVVSKIRPHPGQIEVAANITHLLRGAKLVGNDKSQLLPLLFTRKMPQDRYSLRTAPQWLSPLIEAVVRATRTLEIEINSVTDNPLIDPEQQRSLHGGNFQAFAVTDVMDHIRLHLHAAGKLMFAQHCELMNPDLNQGLPANLGWGHPSTDFGHKGLDVSMASYMSELADLSSPISLFVQSAELNNQSVNSLALLSARKTERAIEVFQMMLSCLLLSLCQGADMRALEHKIKLGVDRQIAIAVGKLGITDVAHRAEVEKKAVEIFSDTVLERRELDWVDRVDAAIQNVLGIMSKSLYSNITISQLSRVGSGLRDGVLECIHMSRGEVGGGNGNQVLADGSKVLYTHIRDSLKM